MADLGVSTFLRERSVNDGRVKTEGGLRLRRQSYIICLRSYPVVNTTKAVRRLGPKNKPRYSRLPPTTLHHHHLLHFHLQPTLAQEPRTMAASDAQSEATQGYQLLSATYRSPHNAAFTYTQKLPTPPSTQTADRTAYLGALRKATAVMQEQINKEITLRMEEDKAREAEGLNGLAKAKGVDEAKEEDNYGEEVAEEE